jgi:hypothetical protein
LAICAQTSKGSTGSKFGWDPAKTRGRRSGRLRARLSKMLKTTSGVVVGSLRGLAFG